MIIGIGWPRPVPTVARSSPAISIWCITFMFYRELNGLVFVSWRSFTPFRKSESRNRKEFAFFCLRLSGSADGIQLTPR